VFDFQDGSGASRSGESLLSVLMNRARHGVRNVTTPAARSTDSTTTPAKCGSNRPNPLNRTPS
jgi:hypothetical protein